MWQLFIYILLHVRWAPAARTDWCLVYWVLRLGVPDGLIHTQNHASRFAGCSDGIAFHQSGFPHKLREVVGNIFISNVDSSPDIT